MRGLCARRLVGVLLAGGPAALVLVWAAVAGPLEDGRGAVGHGDYATSMRLWHPLAEQAAAPVASPAPANPSSTDRVLAAAMNAPPQDLAMSYLTAKTMLQMTDLARKPGITVKTVIDGRPVTVDTSNADAIARYLSARRTAYAAAIERRGSSRIAGHYMARATKECSAAMTAGAVLAAAGSEGFPGDIAVTQDGFGVNLAETLSSGGKSVAVPHAGVVVEKSIVIVDAMNSDFTYVGSVSEGGIELRPFVEGLKASYANYPAFIPIAKPDWATLSRCVITLQPRQAASP